MSIPHRTCRALAAGTLTLAAGVALAGPAAADPPGNNGTIKVDGVVFDNHPDNEPHVGCAFAIDFYGYEASIPVSMVFSLHAPTGSGVLETVAGVLDGDDSDGGGSEAGHDGHFAVDLGAELAGVTPHQNQGFHVRLDITAEDGTPQGSDGKSKVYWVTGCTTPATPPPPPPPVVDTPPPPIVVTPPPAPFEQVLSASATAAPDPAPAPVTEVLGTTEARALPRTGAAIGALAGLGALLGAGGAGSLGLARRLRRR